MVRPWYWPEGGMPERAAPFDWIIRKQMAASWWPDKEVLGIYKKEGIKVIINCSEFDNRKEIPSEFKYYHINIPDYGVPTEDQVRRFIKITEEHGYKNDPIVVHCVAGCGRTGQLIVIWAAYNNHIPNNIDPIIWVRKKRLCSLETKEQQSLARKMARKYQGKKKNIS